MRKPREPAPLLALALSPGMFAFEVEDIKILSLQECAMADKPVDAEGARVDLGFGNQYFDRWFNEKSSEQKSSSWC